MSVLRICLSRPKGLIHENAIHSLALASTESMVESGFAPIFPDTCYHLTHYWLAAVDIPVASDNP
ncbi:hypothetical protein QSI38_20565, partial [Escherichia coli]